MHAARCIRTAHPARALLFGLVCVLGMRWCVGGEGAAIKATGAHLYVFPLHNSEHISTRQAVLPVEH